MRFLLACLLLLAGAAVAVLLIERDRLSRALVAERARRAEAEAQGRRLQDALGSRTQEMERLSEEIQASMDQGRARERFLEELERRTRPQPASRPEPTPEERGHAQDMLALAVSLNRLLAASGHARVRFFAIERVEGKALVDVALHHLDADGLVAHAVRADRLFLVLDPAARVLRLASPRGRELLDGRWIDFGPEGFELCLGEVDPAPWKLFALAPVEILPEPPPPPEPPRPIFDRTERKEWLRRFALLLQAEPGFTRRRYRLEALENLEPGGFQGVTLLGYTPAGLLAERFQAGRLRVEAAAEGGIRLLLRDGFHEDEKGRHDLPQAGYLLYFPGADREAWAKALGDRFHCRGPENP